MLADGGMLFLQDIVLHVMWILCWFIGSVDWAVAFHRLDNLLNDYMDDLEVSDCTRRNETVYVEEKDREPVVYVQAQIAVVSLK